jgi:hypothetical protein
MPLVYVEVPAAKRAALLNALRELNPKDVEIVAETDQSGRIGLAFDDMVDPTRAAFRVGDILNGTGEIAGEPFETIATVQDEWGPPGGH